MSAARFHPLRVKRVTPEAAGSVAIAFEIPEAHREAFRFEPGQFLTLRAEINGHEVRRNYSISCERSRLERQGELEVGIRPVEGGVFSNWAAQQLSAGDIILQVGDQLVGSPQELAGLAGKLPKGQPIPLLIQRNEGRLFLPLTITG